MRSYVEVENLEKDGLDFQNHILIGNTDGAPSSRIENYTSTMRPRLVNGICIQTSPKTDREIPIPPWSFDAEVRMGMRSPNDFRYASYFTLPITYFW